MIAVISQIVSDTFYAPGQTGIGVRVIQTYSPSEISEIPDVGMPRMGDCLSFLIICQEIKVGRCIHAGVIFWQVDAHEKG